MIPTVSVIIPAYNHERFIGAAVESVLNQTYDHLELIVIDDGSTDGTGEVVRSFADQRLSYHYQENQDAYNTLNRGLGMARGDYISILNSDDVYMPDRLEKIMQARQLSASQCLFTDVIPIDDDGRQMADPEFGWNQWHQKNRSFFFQCGDLYTAFLKGNFMVTTSNLFLTRTAAEKVGKFCSLRYLHDYDYIFRIMLAFPDQVEYLHDQKLLQYRIHGGNTLGEAAITGREQDKEVIRKYMLARIPGELQGVVAAGSDRLVELEQELAAVRNTLYQPGEAGIKAQIVHLARSIKKRCLP